MGKLLLLSIIVAPVVIAARAANEKSARGGLRKTLVRVAVFNAVYLVFLLFIYGRI